MHVLIALRSSEYYRFVEGIVEEIVQRGGRVTLITSDAGHLAATAPVSQGERVSVQPAHAGRGRAERLLRVARETRSYLHWAKLGGQPRFLLDRWLNYIPRPMRFLLRLARFLQLEQPLADSPLPKALEWVENNMKPDATIVKQVQAAQADLVLITPLLYPRAWEVDYLKACLLLKQPHAALVASWDNLTSKGIFHVRPDKVIVWNNIQIAEAVRYHGLSESGLIAAGAPVFDWMFDRELLEDRSTFCQSLGIDPTRPYVLYAVSSTIQHGDESEIVSKLHAQLEALGLSHVQLVVRPHPRNRAGWEAFRSSEIRVEFPPSGAGREIAKRNLFNTLYHSAAVVGLNTSVFLETAILDRPGITILFSESPDAARRRHAQFPHFRYLLEGGFLEQAEDEQDCARKIEEIVGGRDSRRASRQAFVERFVRPNGISLRASRVVLSLFEQMLGTRPARSWPGPAANELELSQTKA